MSSAPQNRVGGTIKPFRIAAVVTIAPEKIAVIIDGPGVEPGGLRREFSSRTEAQDVVDAMNRGLEEGLREGTESPQNNGRPFVTIARVQPAKG